jgi:hypothetical protein
MPVCVQKFVGGVLVSRVCATDKPWPERSDEKYDIVSSCTECPPFPTIGTIQKEELKAMIKEILAELLPGAGAGRGGGA